MKKSRLLGIVCALTFLFAFTSSHAAIVVGSSNPTAVVELGGNPFGQTNVEVTFDDLTPIWIDFENFSACGDCPPGGPDSFKITVINNTQAAWTDFHFDFVDSAIPNPQFFVDPFGLGQVTTIVENDAAWVFFTPPEAGGFQARNDLFTVNDYFSLQIVPTVPIPAAVWLFGSGLLGLVGMARRKKAV